ncbi:nucleotidyltransferase domain-containing protein [Nocardia salmonicida]|uniref:nucleotidyltransferase domain-containing protein n=1 Tax=Nocardia salmonicida TaxID=53431 RepID=UPI0007A54F1A|nr:nucleotidyltransferase domain-containing protein [Nocardia salmonicida]
MSISPIVTDTVESYLALADAEAPGLIEGLYLEGSVALGDFHPKASDIDFVAVTATPPDAAALATLERIHTQLRRQRPRPFFDGTYLTWNDLAAGPTAAVDRPISHEGQLQAESVAGQQTPVAWHTLAHHGVALRGPAIGDLGIWTDPAALAAWQNTNLEKYWANGLSRAARLISKPGLGLLTDYGTVWTVTGIARIHYTLATGDITSKDGAGRHALHTFPDRWHRIINEALRLRRGDSRQSLYRNPLARRRDILAFGHMAITNAHNIYDNPSPEDVG